MVQASEVEQSFREVCSRLGRQGLIGFSSAEAVPLLPVQEQYLWAKPDCVSHRAFAERAGLGWRGRHSLIVTSEAGPALRLATLFLPGRIAAPRRELAGCGECRACLDVCPILRRTGDYQDACRRRIDALGLESDVCGICVRVCWEAVVAGRRTARPPA